MVALRLTLLGGFDARLAAGDAVSLPTKKAQALVAYLGLRPGQTHQRDKLAALLWGERSDERARDGLRHALGALRKALPGVKTPSLLAEGQTLALNPAVVEVDVATFERRVAEGTPAALEHAAELYRGDLLLGFTVSEPLFEEWLVAERERLREIALEALARLLAHQAKSGGTERAIQTAIRLLGLDPLQEAVHRTLMRLYARQGRRGAALKQYQACVGVLQRELGVEPDAETKQLYQELLRRPASATRAPGFRGDDRSRPARLAARARVELPAGDTPLFGREVELGRLRELLEEAIRGHGQVATVLGEAGIGKTRLLAAVAADALQRGCRVFIGRCYESDSILPFGPWVDACRRGEISGDEELLGSLQPTWRAELTRLFPEVHRAGLPPASDSSLRLFESMAYLFEQVATRQPVVVILEDLHCADEMSFRLLGFVGRRIREQAVLLVTTARQEELDDLSVARRILRELSRESEVVELELAPLSRPETSLLVRALARGGNDVQLAARLEDQVWAVSEGNPFVAVETTRALQSGAIPPDARTLPLPQRVRELLAHRLERLSDLARELAALAAVIGREFEFSLLQQAGGFGEEATAAAVEELVRRHVLRGVGEGFDFSHDRIRAVVYDQLLPPRRKLLHRRVGEALEVLYVANLDPHYLALGTHFREGTVWEKAVSHLWRAGTRAAARSAYRQAVACFEQALDALEHLPETSETLAHAIDLHLEARRALYPLAEIDAIFGHLQRAEAGAVTLGDQRRLAEVLANLTQYFWQVGELVRGLETGQRAVAIAEALDDLSLRVAADQYLGQVLLDRGAHREATVIFGRHVDELEGDRVRQHFGMAGYPSVFYRFLLGYCHAELGQFINGVALGEQALRIAEEIDQPYARALGCLWLGRIRLVQGEFAQARRVLEQGVEIAEARQLGTPILVAALGYARAMSGQLPSGIPRLEKAEADLRESKSPGRLALVSGWLGEAYLTAGRLADAAEIAQRALALARDHHQRGFEGWTLRLLAEIAGHGSPPRGAGAEESYRQALALAEELGMRPLVAHCHLGLGKLYGRTGNREQAQEHLATATTMYREMGMTYWLEKAEAE
jgi:DNA-binding SARP family transcriptional activator